MQFMTDTLLNKISKSSNSTIITDTWLTGQTGEIVDIKGDYVFRFIDFITDNGEILNYTIKRSKRKIIPFYAGQIWK